MSTRNRIAIGLGLSVYLAAAQAQEPQTGNPAVMAPDTPKNEVAQTPPDYPNTVDQIFARQAFIGGQAEVDLAKLALQRAQSREVKQFAQHMVDDHGKANDRLAKLGKGNKAVLPKGPDADPDARAVRAQLEKFNGQRFDLEYMAVQIGDHQKTAQLLEHEIGSGQDVQMKNYAKETLPVVLKHLDMAKTLHAQLASAPPPK
jgi:putative membrane protein